MTERPYQVCLYVGDNPPQLDGVKVVDLTPATASTEAVLDRLKDSDLTPADLRSRAYLFPDGHRDLSLVVYAALIGFAGRRIDLATPQGFAVDATALDAAARRLPDAGRPAEPIDHLQLGPVTHPDLPSIDKSAMLRPSDVTAIRYARRLRFVPVDDVVEALSQLVVVAAIRSRRDGADRLPFLCVGDEPAVLEDRDTVVGVCLDTIRRAAVDLRRSLRSDDRDAVVEPIALTPRQLALVAAADRPIEETMVRLGAALNEATGMWHCPRPERHTHGDKNASMKSVKGRVQCLRCDPERVDSLRLTMDTLGVSADEAAEWLADVTNHRPQHNYAA
jgi:hypothetical protein